MIADMLVDEGLSRTFANQYQALYNSVQHCVSYDDKMDGISLVKSGKKDLYGLMYSDHYIYGTTDYTSCLQC